MLNLVTPRCIVFQNTGNIVNKIPIGIEYESNLDIPGYCMIAAVMAGISCIRILRKAGIGFKRAGQDAEKDYK